jgi:hypothetical protein
MAQYPNSGKLSANKYKDTPAKPDMVGELTMDRSALKQLLEEQQKLSEKELDFLRKEKNYSEKIKSIESNNFTELKFNKDLEDLQKKHLELLTKEKELFEKETKLEMLEIKEKKIQQDQNELSLKISELTKKEKEFKLKESLIY